MTLMEWRSRSSLLSELSDDHFALLDSVASGVSFGAGDTVFRVNEPANRFYLVTSGTIALQIAGGARPSITIETLGPGAMLGLSWHVAPYRWQWTARSVDDSTLAEFDANQVLSACEQDPALENALLRVIAGETGRRLQNVRLQLLDLYGGK
ncbi:MAG: Crp/Fnr family transcriptional regulator [Acidimicrobiia bacterium]